MTEEDQAQGQALRESFKHIAGEDLEVDAFELQEILNTVFTKGRLTCLANLIQPIKTMINKCYLFLPVCQYWGRLAHF